jgi:hypothetical protein
MTERFRPHPENPKQHAPEAGAGPLGLPPPGSEQSPQGEGSKSPERQPLLEHGEGQGEDADLNVSSANTGDAESPEAELKSKTPIKHPRRRLAFPCPPISEIDNENWRNNRRQNPPSSTDH